MGRIWQSPSSRRDARNLEAVFAAWERPSIIKRKIMNEKLSATTFPPVERATAKVYKRISVVRDGRRGTSSRTKKAIQVGQLEVLLQMPLDIFCEVAGHLSPLDLLKMSRSSKALRSLLTSRRSRSIWRAASYALGMPECPPELSEMQYADLIFGNNCYLCPAGKVKSTYFSNKLRLCNNCRVQNMVVLLGHEEQHLKCAGIWEILHLKKFPGMTCYSLKEAASVWKELHSFEADSDEQKTFLARKRRSVVEANMLAEKVHACIYSWENRS